LDFDILSFGILSFGILDIGKRTPQYRIQRIGSVFSDPSVPLRLQRGRLQRGTIVLVLVSLLPRGPFLTSPLGDKFAPKGWILSHGGEILCSPLHSTKQ
jgi:hypothetical protein